MSEDTASTTRRNVADASRGLIRRALQPATRPITSTKFGPESAVLLHMVTNEKPDIPVVWVDTGYNTRATQLFADRLTSQLDLNLHIYRPLHHSWAEIPALDDPAHGTFAHCVKLEPFQRALAELQPDTWFSSIRREQTTHRARQQALSRGANTYLKVSPLLEWTRAEMQGYMQEYGLPSESDYFDPTKGEAKRECGLHLRF